MTAAGKVPSRAEILARKTGRGVVTIPDLGEFHIRALSRDEALRVHACESIGAGENLMVSLGLVDPALSADDVAEWAAAEGSAGELQALSMAIGKISGMTSQSGKESYKSA